MTSVLTVIGVGGMGEAVARRLGSGRPLLIADYDTEHLTEVESALRRSGFDVTAQAIDVADRDQVAALADRAASLGEVTSLVHTAGVSPAQATPERIVEVNLVGTAYVIEEFGRVIADGGAGVVIASVAAHIFADAVTPEQGAALSTLPASELAGLPMFAFPDMQPEFACGLAYGYSKRGNVFEYSPLRRSGVTAGRASTRCAPASPRRRWDGVSSTPSSRIRVTRP
ncbi:MULTISPECIES: SDR family NAD(P)-dependent oxidoreductase [Gordonia]|uniref:SDR family NAD(P)-dependent oxidoreductase n=1 Tax=Gordonia TaxID=2053 RepID=UPI000B21D33D|nr:MULTISPECIES: SDR family NAD(P)-dependent oxidoreductase [Gordonia]